MENLSLLPTCAIPLEISISSRTDAVDYNLSAETPAFTVESVASNHHNVLAELDSCHDFVDVSYLSSSVQFLSSVKDPELCTPDTMDLIMDNKTTSVRIKDEEKFSYQDPLLNQGNMVAASASECDPLKDDYIDFSLLSMMGYGLDCTEALEVLPAAAAQAPHEKPQDVAKRKKRKQEEPQETAAKPAIVKQCLLNTGLLSKLKGAAASAGARQHLIATVRQELESARVIVKISIKAAKGDEVDIRRDQNSDPKFVVGNYMIRQIVNAKDVEAKKAAAVAAAPPQQVADRDFINDALRKHSVTDESLYCVVTTTGLHMWLCPYSDCGRGLYKLHALKRHLVIHFGVKPFKCEFPDCKWSFFTLFRLKRHQDTHSKEKHYKCPEQGCDRAFTTVYNLRCHRKQHDKPAIYKCHVNTCNYLFKTIRMRDMHLRTHQKEEAPFKCNFRNCGKTYFSLNSLTAHSRAHSHKEADVKCSWSNCGRTFDQPCRLREHMRQHTGDKPYICDYKDCTWAFPSASKLRRHQNTHRKDRPYHCTIGTCTKAFFRSEHLKEHTLTHIAQRTFQCELCLATFSSKSSIYVHNKKVHPGQVPHTTLTSCLKDEHLEQQIIEAAASCVAQDEPLSLDNISAVLMNDNEVLIQIPDIVDISTFNIDIGDLAAAKRKQEAKETNPDIILEQAIQSLGVPADIMLTDNQDHMLTGLLLTEETEFEERANITQLLDVTDSNYSESTINLRDLD